MLQNTYLLYVTHALVTIPAAIIRQVGSWMPDPFPIKAIIDARRKHTFTLLSVLELTLQLFSSSLKDRALTLFE